MSSKNDKFYLKLALNLAKQHEGLTSENPSVGCVIVKNNNILSLSKTSINGRPHAEVNAIRLANTNDLKGSTMYVTLEPCSHKNSNGISCARGDPALDNVPRINGQQSKSCASHSILLGLG